MRRIERTKAFKKDYQRAIATPKHRDLGNVLPALIALLATDIALKIRRSPLTRPVEGFSRLSRQARLSSHLS